MRDLAWLDLFWERRGLKVLQGHKEWCNLCLFSAYTRKCRHRDTFTHTCSHTHMRAHTLELQGTPLRILFLTCRDVSMHSSVSLTATIALTYLALNSRIPAMFLQAGCLFPSSKFGQSMTSVTAYVHTHSRWDTHAQLTAGGGGCSEGTQCD